MKLSSQPPAISAPKIPLAFRTRRQFHDTPGDIIFRAALSALAPLALAAALLAIPAGEARAHNDTSAMFHAETYPLQEAAEAGDLDSVNHFLAVHGADVNAKDDENYTPLIEAAYWGRIVVVSTLIAAGADVNAKTNYGYTPLSEAVRRGHIAVVSTLIAAGADVNATTSYDETPLHEAAHHGPASIVSILLAAGADVNIKRGDGETPLHLAAGNGHADIASMLLSAGADVNAKDNYGNTPLHEPDTASVASVLIAAGANVNAKNQYGDTPLRDTTNWAAGPLIISVLIAAGGHWGEACESGNVVNPAGPSPPCVAVAETSQQTCTQQNREGGANTTGCGDCLTNFQEFGNQCERPISCAITGQTPNNDNSACECPEDTSPHRRRVSSSHCFLHGSGLVFAR